MNVVSVCMITYNHEKYISEAIEGILMQRTSFSVELIIGEDCSTDNTRKICKEYNEKYPDKIKLLLPNKNLGAMNNFITTLQYCTGKYIALCEGDDYWTDPYKLQKQVDFLERNDSFNLIASKNYILNNGEIKIKHNLKFFPKYEFKIDYYLKYRPFQTASILFRNNSNSLPDWFTKVMAGDKFLVLLAVKDKKIKLLNDYMSVYRIHKNGISQKTRNNSTQNFYTYLKYYNDYTNQKLSKLLSFSLRKNKFTIELQSKKGLLEKIVFILENISIASFIFYSKFINYIDFETKITFDENIKF